MRLELTGRHVEISPTIRRLVDRKLTKLERLLNDSAVSAQVVLTREKRRHRAELTLHARGERFFHSANDSPSWETSLARAIAKVAQQAHKVKGKWQERKRRAVKARPPVAPVSPAAPRVGDRVGRPRIVRATRQSVKTMSLADATRLVEADGDDLVVFHDSETATLSVLYRRRGELTLVQTGD